MSWANEVATGCRLSTTPPTSVNAQDGPDLQAPTEVPWPRNLRIGQRFRTSADRAAFKITKLRFSGRCAAAHAHAHADDQRPTGGGPRVQAAAVSWIGIPAGTPRSGWRFGVDQGVHWSVPPQLAAAACDETLKRRPAAFAATVRTWTSGLA